MRTELRRIATIAVVAGFALAAAPAMSQDDATKDAAKDAAKPRILIEEMRHDLGEVYEADKYSWKFTVKNAGDADLKIEKVKPG
jgi:hypothetical protein